MSRRYSHALSKLLRHCLKKFKYDNKGFVLLSDILSDPIMTGCSEEDVSNIVKEDRKTRFTLEIRDNKLYIRANQGHTKGLILDDDLMHTRIMDPTPYVSCFHGTFEKFLNPILSEGLSSCSRRHIHIAIDEDAPSGRRSTCTHKIIIDIKAAMDDGIKFYLSSNGVILTCGNSYGFLEPKYLSKVVKLNKN